jgi:hypothetical protein
VQEALLQYQNILMTQLNVLLPPAAEAALTSPS